MEVGVANRSEEMTRKLAEEGVRHRVRPILEHGSSIAPRLFGIQDLLDRRSRALMLLQASFDSTEPARLSRHDERTYRREVDRRKKDIRSLESARDELLAVYADELMSSKFVHPELAGVYDLIR